MKSPEVQFNPDERALLDLLHAGAAPDGCIRAWDTQLIADLGLSEEELSKRFFAPKVRLLAAGAIGLYIGVDGTPIIRLNGAECPNREISKRYVFAVVPLENVNEIRRVVRRRQNARNAGKANAPQMPEGHSAGAAQAAARAIGDTGATSTRTTRSLTLKEIARREAAQKRGMQRLGVHPVETAPSPDPEEARSVAHV